MSPERSTGRRRGGKHQAVLPVFDPCPEHRVVGHNDRCPRTQSFVDRVRHAFWVFVPARNDHDIVIVHRRHHAPMGELAEKRDLFGNATFARAASECLDVASTDAGQSTVASDVDELRGCVDEVADPLGFSHLSYIEKAWCARIAGVALGRKIFGRYHRGPVKWHDFAAGYSDARDVF